MSKLGIQYAAHSCAGPEGWALEKERIQGNSNQMWPNGTSSKTVTALQLGGAPGDGCGVKKPYSLQWQVELDNSPSLEEGCSGGAGAQGAACTTLSISASLSETPFLKLEHVSTLLLGQS